MTLMTKLRGHHLRALKQKTSVPENPGRQNPTAASHVSDTAPSNGQDMRPQGFGSEPDWPPQSSQNTIRRNVIAPKRPNKNAILAYVK